MIFARALRHTHKMCGHIIKPTDGSISAGTCAGCCEPLYQPVNENTAQRICSKTCECLHFLENHTLSERAQRASKPLQHNSFSHQKMCEYMIQNIQPICAHGKQSFHKCIKITIV